MDSDIIMFLIALTMLKGMLLLKSIIKPCVTQLMEEHVQGF